MRFTELKAKKVYKNYVYGPYWIVNLHYLQEEVTLAKLLDLDSYKALSEKYQTLLSYYSDAGLYDIFLPTKSSSHDLLESNIEPFNELEETLIRLRKKAGLE